jgi:hypothetical protein
MYSELDSEVLFELHETWRQRLAEAQRRHRENPNIDTRRTCLRLLRIFSELVQNRVTPQE